jgi:hypothetical protein
MPSDAERERLFPTTAFASDGAPRLSRLASS